MKHSGWMNFLNFRFTIFRHKRTSYVLLDDLRKGLKLKNDKPLRRFIAKNQHMFKDESIEHQGALYITYAGILLFLMTCRSKYAEQAQEWMIENLSQGLMTQS